MTDIDILLSERSIEQVIIDYGAHNDASDWDAVVALFTPEGRMSRPTAPDDFIEGREAILTAFKSRPARTTRHICANIRVDVDSDSATATSQILLFTGHDAPKVGSYADKFTRTTDGWRFTERRGSMDFPI